MPAAPASQLDDTIPPTPTGMTPDEMVALVAVLADHLLIVAGLAHATRGGKATWDRCQAPKPGDLVTLMGAMGPPARRIGWLREVKAGASKYDTEYTVEHMDGETVQWSNVEAKAVPVGSVYAASILDDPDAVFQPRAKDPR